MAKRGKQTTQSSPGQGGPATPARPSQADIEEVHRLLVRFQTRVERRLPVLLLSLATPVLLTLSFEPFGLSGLAWFAMVPWLVAVAVARRWAWMLFCSWLAGFLFFGGNLYWLGACGYPGPISDVLLMVGATAALAAYLGLYFLLFAYVVGGLLRRWQAAAPAARPSGLMMVYSVPIAWVGTEILRGYMLSGFPWFLLGQTQYQVTWLIQVADLGGVYAVGALVAAVNGLLADGMLQPLFLPTRRGPRPNYRVSAATLGLAGVMLFALVYGRWRIQTYDDYLIRGPRVAVIQDNFAISLAGPRTVEEYVQVESERFEVHFNHSLQAVQSRPKPDLTVWPETMIGIANLNDEYLNLPWGRELWRQVEMSRELDQRLRRQAADNDVALLVGAISQVPVPHDWIEKRGQGVHKEDFQADPVGKASYLNPQVQRRNSAILYRPATMGTTQPVMAGEVVKDRYDKTHLVPFGELIPFRESWPPGFHLLRSLTPMQLLVEGDRTEPMSLWVEGPDGPREFHFATAICYEDVMPQTVRRLVWSPDGHKLADFVVNISNDGWFTGTTELRQHWSIAVFRCVENRVPMARSVNGGCSGFIDSLGRPKLGSPMSPGEKGYLAHVMAVDARYPLYARIGDVPGWVCVGLLVAGWALVFVLRRRARRGRTGASGEK